jgi:sulfide:quinone oxidoreductase
MDAPHHHPPARRVVIAGAGVAALEALLALRALAGEDVGIHVLAPGDAFLRRPLSVGDCFGRSPAPEVDITALLRSQHVTRTVDVLEAVDPLERTVRGHSGALLEYDELVVAIGARAVPMLPGALAFRGRADVPALLELLRELEAGRVSHVVFALPEGNAWPLPLYELAVLSASRIRARRLEAQVSIVSAEHAPLECLGAAASDAMAALLHELGIDVRLDARASAFRDGVLALADGSAIGADRVVALPRLRGPAIKGLPADAGGFIPVDRQGRVGGLDGIYAAGDATACLLKHGGLAATQADAIAELIAQRAGAPVTPRPYPTTIRGLLLAGPEPLYVRIEAVHAQLAPALARGAGPAPSLGAPRHPEALLHPGSLWWPPSGMAGRHLGASLADGPGAEPRSARNGNAVELMLLLADFDAWVGDHAMALAGLDAVELLTGTLPPPYTARRGSWLEEQPRQAPAACA